MGLRPEIRGVYSEMKEELILGCEPRKWDWINCIDDALKSDSILNIGNDENFKKFYRRRMQKLTEREEKKARWKQAKAEQREYVRLYEPEEPLFDKRKIVITDHARERFVQRFVEGEALANIDEVIIDLLLQSGLYKLSEREKLRELILHKENAEHYSYKKCGFVVVREDDVIVVLTVKVL